MLLTDARSKPVMWHYMLRIFIHQNESSRPGNCVNKINNNILVEFIPIHLNNRKKYQTGWDFFILNSYAVMNKAQMVK